MAFEIDLFKERTSFSTQLALIQSLNRSTLTELIFAELIIANLPQKSKNYFCKIILNY